MSNNFANLPTNIWGCISPLSPRHLIQHLRLQHLGRAKASNGHCWDLGKGGGGSGWLGPWRILPVCVALTHQSPRSCRSIMQPWLIVCTFLIPNLLVPIACWDKAGNYVEGSVIALSAHWRKFWCNNYGRRVHQKLGFRAQSIAWENWDLRSSTNGEARWFGALEPGYSD